MDSRSGGLGRLVQWYSGPVGLAFGGGLGIAVLLAVVDMVAASIVVAVVVLAVVVPWKLTRQRREYVDQIAALRAENSAMREQLDQLARDVGARLEAALTKKTVRPILQEFRKMDRERINGLQAQIVQIQEELAPPDDEAEDEPEVVG